MSAYLIQPQDAIVESKILKLYNYDSKTQLTPEQVDLFYKNPLPEGKRRKAGTLELEDIPQPSTSQLFGEEFKALKKEYNKDVQTLNIAFASAAMVDGPSQVDKQSSIRTQYNTRKAEYDAAVAALRTKYYG